MLNETELLAASVENCCDFGIIYVHDRTNDNNWYSYRHCDIVSANAEKYMCFYEFAYTIILLIVNLKGVVATLAI